LVRVYSGASTRMSVGRFLQQGAAGNADTSDDDFANVVLLLDGDGTSGDNNETFTDSSTNGFTVTESGSVVQGSFSPYGDNWSNSFDGNSDALTIADSADFDFGTGDFTMEAWIYPRSLSDVNDYNSIVSAHNPTAGSPAAGESWLFTVLNNQKLTVYGSGGTTSSSNATVSLNEWSHVMITRSSGTIRFFINGTLDTNTPSVTGNFNCTSAGLAIGRQANPDGSTTRYWDGWISNVRLVKGTALQTSSFTPSTSPLTAVTNTVLLACQSNRFVDNSSSSHTLTPTGTVAVTPFSPFKDDDARDITTDGGSAYFNYGPYLTLPQNTAFNFGTGDFTVEFWANVDTYRTSGSYFDCFVAFGHYTSSPYFRITHTGELTCGLVSAAYSSTSTIDTGEWNHFAITRSGTTVRIFVNGTLETTGTNSANLGNSSSVYIGTSAWLPTAEEMKGYLSDVRIVKGTAVYTSSFTPPTAPLTAVTNTSALLNFQDAGIYDRSGINNIDTVGNAQIDTAVKKYGTGSMQFDGSGDYLLFPSSEAFGYSTGDFTLECWVYKDANPSADAGIIEQRPASTNGNYPMLGLNSSGQLFYYVNAAYKISASASTALSNQAWDHVAYVRSGGNLGTLYINGTSVGTWVDTTDYVSETPLRVGEHAFSAAQFNGFIDDLRITKGVARYTANFTAPTDALPKF